MGGLMEQRTAGRPELWDQACGHAGMNGSRYGVDPGRPLA